LWDRLAQQCCWRLWAYFGWSDGLAAKNRTVSEDDALSLLVIAAAMSEI
jgi:hypothetical protein